MKEKPSELVSNRRATFDYQVLDTYEAGLALKGTEIKSLRDHGGNLQDAYVSVLEGEAWLLGCHISPFRFGNLHNHPEKRDRKLLLHKREIAKISQAVQEKGLTCIPLSIFLKQGRAKVKIALCRGKKTYDKREAIKERDEKRTMDKIRKEHR